MDDLTRRLAGLSPEKRELLLRRVGSRAAGPAPGAAPSAAAGPERLPATPEQEEIWLVDQVNPGTAAFMIAIAGKGTGRFDQVAFQRSLEEIARRHETLRTTFRLENDRPVQVIHPSLAPRFRAEDLSTVCAADREDEARRLMAEEFRRPVDLSTGPLFASLVLRMGPVEHVLGLAVHHIVADAWSIGVLLDELDVLYCAFSRGGGATLPDPPPPPRFPTRRTSSGTTRAGSGSGCSCRRPNARCGTGSRSSARPRRPCGCLSIALGRSSRRSRASGGWSTCRTRSRPRSGRSGASWG